MSTFSRSLSELVTGANGIRSTIKLKEKRCVTTFRDGHEGDHVRGGGGVFTDNILLYNLMKVVFDQCFGYRLLVGY